LKAMEDLVQSINHINLPRCQWHLKTILNAQKVGVCVGIWALNYSTQGSAFYSYHALPRGLDMISWP